MILRYNFTFDKFYNWMMENSTKEEIELIKIKLAKYAEYEFNSQLKEEVHKDLLK